jgi:hypothetical protein
LNVDYSMMLGGCGKTGVMADPSMIVATQSHSKCLARTMLGSAITPVLALAHTSELLGFKDRTSLRATLAQQLYC